MSPQILAAVVLYAIPPEGASYWEVLRRFEWLCEECRRIKRDLGFRAESERALKYAVSLCDAVTGRS
jgi:hypothetical protein